ncbi:MULTISPECIES: adenylate/guanylate cyclase domain-containing protein [unclassified Ruegeria]|uniref:adenylate/guanylate cyclase domain-containing protein n=1 Tax=unclassified Ruegeria TaxID=2625375 RepID=UPI00210FE7D2|nr:MULTISPECIES: adenylate/guanylate cyclase domain-containing protein [unclassified Ruegeria]
MADVVEYSRLMREDETGTLAALQQFWAEIFDPIVAERRGRIVKKMGDGALLEFSSVVDAVEAALKIQRRNIEVNGKIRLRIGVNLGDIIIDDDDIFGDGVNVAARLEALAEPDGICISLLVHESVGNRVEAIFVDAGEHNIKGLERPIRVFRWPEKGAVQAKQDKPSIAILPFENLSSDPDDEYFSQGVADDIATDLSKISGLFVVARNATREYKNRSQSVGEAAVELGVRYILQGTVRRGSGRVRVNASLIDTDNSIQLWADRFDGDLAEVFEFQDRIAESIVATLAVTLTQAEQDRAFRKEVKSLKAYDYVLQGNAFHARSTKIDNAKAMEHYSRAIELDPEYAPAHAGLAWALVHDANQRWGYDPEASLDLALKHAKRAVQLDVSLGKAHMVLGDVYCWTKRHSLAVAEGRKAVELEPSNADAHFALGYYLIAAGASEEAVREAQLALRYNPVFAMGFYYEVLGTALYLTKSYDAAIAALEEGLGKYPDHDGLHQLLSATYAKLDVLDAARMHSQEYLRLRPEDSLTKISERLPYKNKSDLEHLIDGLRLAGFPE